MYNFDRTWKYGKTKHLSFPGTRLKQLLQYVDVNLKMLTPYVNGQYLCLIDKSQLNTENRLNNTKYMVDKCRKFGVRNGWKMVE